MNTASQNLPYHLGVLRERMLHPTDYELALNYFLEEFAGDTGLLDASEPDAAPHLLAVLAHVAGKALGEPVALVEAKLFLLREHRFYHGNAAKAFGSVKIPWMLMTGTKDVSPIGDQDAASRLAVYPLLHGAAKYEVVLFNAEHSVFTDRPLPGDREPRNPNHHRVILALSTAFWDAYLRGDTDALAWLNGAGPRSVMEPADRWQCANH